MLLMLILAAAMGVVIGVALVVTVARLRGKKPPALTLQNEPDKITRIKQYREQHPSVSLKEAKDAVEGQLPDGANRAPHVGEASVQTLVDAGRLIEAIKLYRSQHGVGLKEAKEAVERMRRT